MQNSDQFKFPVVHGHIRIHRADDESQVLFEADNVICSGASYLFARLLSDNAGVKAGVWGLALGNGATSVGNESAITNRLVNEIKRIPLMDVISVDDVGVQQTTLLTTRRKFLTKVNVTTQGIVGHINEMGLIGGGKSDTDMLTTPMFDPDNQGATPKGSAILINYKTFPNFTLPPDIDFIFSWALSC